MMIRDIPESAWYPLYGAFQTYPREFPVVARHALLLPTVTGRATWEDIAWEAFRTYGLRLVGHDDWFMYFLGSKPGQFSV